MVSAQSPKQLCWHWQWAGTAMSPLPVSIPSSHGHSEWTVRIKATCACLLAGSLMHIQFLLASHPRKNEYLHSEGTGRRHKQPEPALLDRIMAWDAGASAGVYWIPLLCFKPLPAATFHFVALLHRNSAFSSKGLMLAIQVQASSFKEGGSWTQKARGCEITARPVPPGGCSQMCAREESTVQPLC